MNLHCYSAAKRELNRVQEKVEQLMSAMTLTRRFRTFRSGDAILNGDRISRQLHQATAELKSAMQTLDAVMEAMTPEERQSLSIEAANALCADL